MTYWRYLFAVGVGGVLALGMMRRSVPESPRWLVMKGRYGQAEMVVKSIEQAVVTKRIFLEQTMNYNENELENI